VVSLDRRRFAFVGVSVYGKLIVWCGARSGRKPQVPGT